MYIFFYLMYLFVILYDDFKIELPEACVIYS